MLRRVRRIIEVAAIAAVLASILWLTLTPGPGSGSGDASSFWCITCDEFAILDIASNIILFAPLGLMLAFTMKRRWVPLAICVAATVMIETLQISVVSGRDSSLGDILANSLGGWIGVELALRRKPLLWPEPSTAIRLAVAWCAVVVVACAATTWALGPAFVPRSLWVQWLPPRTGYEPFTGRLLAFDINGIDLPLGFRSASLGVDRRLLSDAWRATATIDRDGVEPRRSVLVRISEEITQPFALEQQGWDLTCLQRTRSAELRLRSPRIALRDALRVSSGVHPDIVRLTCEHRDRALVAGVQAGSESREEVVPLSPSLGWILLSPFDIPLNAGTRWIAALWMIGLTFPIGYWWATVLQGRERSMGTRPVSLVLGAAVLTAVTLGFVIAPLVAGTAFGSWWEWGAVFAGVAVGVVFGRAIRRLPTATRDTTVPTRAAFAPR